MFKEVFSIVEGARPIEKPAISAHLEPISGAVEARLTDVDPKS